MNSTSLNNSRLFQLVIPQAVTQTTPTQSYIPQMPQVSQVTTIPKNYTSQIIVPQTPQISVVPQVPTVQNVAPMKNVPINFAQNTVPQGPIVVPYVLPIGSRFPFIQNHQGLLPIGCNFNNIGGSPYGRVSIIQ